MVAQINDSGAVVLELVLAHLRDVGKLSHFLASGLEVHVRCDIKAANDLCERFESFMVNAQLCAKSFDIQQCLGSHRLFG